MVVEAEVHENYYSENEIDSEESDNEVFNEDIVLDRENANFQRTSSIDFLSIFSVYESKRTLKMTTDTLDCDNILVNQGKDSTLKTLRSWISKSKIPTKDVESRQCKNQLGYASQFEKLFVDNEKQLICRKSKHSP